MNVTLAQLRKLAPTSSAPLDEWVAPLNAAMAEFGITTEARIEMFLAQILHESRGLSALVENLNYSAEGLARTWDRFSASGKRGGAPNALARSLSRRPEAIANEVYANRLGNGSAAGGEGFLYRGRGPIMATGKANYQAIGKALGIDCVNNPDLLTHPVEGARSAAYFWQSHSLNATADKGDFKATTKVINGGDIGGAERIGLWELAKAVIA
jgi:putative chitinase